MGSGRVPADARCVGPTVRLGEASRMALSACTYAIQTRLQEPGGVVRGNNENFRLLGGRQASLSDEGCFITEGTFSLCPQRQKMQASAGASFMRALIPRPMTQR